MLMHIKTNEIRQDIYNDIYTSIYSQKLEIKL